MAKVEQTLLLYLIYKTILKGKSYKLDKQRRLAKKSWKTSQFYLSFAEKIERKKLISMLIISREDFLEKNGNKNL